MRKWPRLTKRNILLMFFITLLIIWLESSWIEKVDENFLSVEKCPSCYGIHCQTFLSPTLKLKTTSKAKLINLLMNIKNVFFAKIEGGVEVVIKKLALSSELTQFDVRLCEAVGFPPECQVKEAISVLVEKGGRDPVRVVKNNDKLFEKSEVIKCRHERVIPFLFERFRLLDNHEDNLHHFLTLLAVNPEPIVIQAFGNVLPLPKVLGVCGRTVMESNCGDRLSDHYSDPWPRRALFALQLLDVANVSSLNEIRIYLTDTSADNFAVDADDKLTLIDAENVVLVDSRNFGLERSVHFNKGEGCRNCFSYEFSEICSHYLADHNYFAICKGLLSEDSFTHSLPGGLLHSIPDRVLSKVPDLRQRIEECSQPNPSQGNRFEPAAALYRSLKQALR